MVKMLWLIRWSGGLACSYGGNYKFTHPFNNNWNSSSQVAVSIDNFILGAIPEVKDLTEATFNNCIIYGSFRMNYLRKNNSSI
jgi:hypothetical protein